MGGADAGDAADSARAGRAAVRRRGQQAEALVAREAVGEHGAVAGLEDVEREGGAREEHHFEREEREPGGHAEI